MSKDEAETLDAEWEEWFKQDQLLVDEVAEKNAQLEIACKEREQHQHERPSLVRLREISERFRRISEGHDWHICVCGSACDVCSGYSVCKRCGLCDADDISIKCAGVKE